MEQTYRIVVEGDADRELKVLVLERDDLEYDKVAEAVIPSFEGKGFHDALVSALRTQGRRLVRVDPVFAGRHPVQAYEFVAVTESLVTSEHCPNCGTVLSRDPGVSSDPVEAEVDASSGYLGGGPVIR